MAPHKRRTLTALGAGVALLAVLGWILWDDRVPRRLAVVVPNQVYRGAWQSPKALRHLITSHHIRTIMTLTAISVDDPKYVAQKPVVDATGLTWVIVPMRGSTATPAQLEEAADLIADPARRPVFFHCVGGHHRSNLVQMAYRIRHEGWDADQAWEEVRAFPWTRPEADADQRDRALINAFAATQRAKARLVAGRATP